MTTHAFDLSQWLPSGATAAGYGIIVQALGPPVRSQWTPVVTGGVGVPPATAQNQIIISGPGPGYTYGVVDFATAMGSTALTNQGGSILPGYGLTFQQNVTAGVRLNGTDPLTSSIDNFGIDCGTY